ncbi:Hypothetical predicted protein [Paramuricea clavata]|nr:Hypothetical predicted protein [Paramuricea clavata]
MRFNTGEKNYYTILKVTPNATQDEIKQAYYKLSKLYHPDTNESEMAHDYFTAINEAYNVLGNLSDRRKYDRGLSITYNPSPAAKQANKGQQSQHFHGKRIVYDFDDWMIKHNQEAMKRRKRNSAIKEQFDKRHVTNEMDIFNRNIIIAAVLTLIGLVVFNGKKVHL